MSANPMALIRVIDNDKDMRITLSQLLSSEGWNVALYESAEHFCAEDNPLVPGCVILDILLPKMSGLQLQNELQKQKYALPIIFVTASAEVGTAVSALRKGAVDFLTKPINDRRLLESVETAVRKDWRGRSQAETHSNAARALDTLTTRELEVCTLIAEGLSNKAIGTQLKIAEKTVKAHRGSVYRKLDVRTPLEVFKLLRAGN